MWSDGNILTLKEIVLIKYQKSEISIHNNISVPMYNSASRGKPHELKSALVRRSYL